MFRVLAMSTVVLCLASTPAFAQKSAERASAPPPASDPSSANAPAANPMADLPWLVGPAEGKIGEQAVVKMDEKYVFLDSAGTRRFLELTGNPPRDNHYVVAPKDSDWFVVFSFDPVGYVKDDEKIDAAALLKSMQDSDRAANEERKRLGMTAMHVDGWTVPPYYDKQTSRLEWGLRLRTEEGSQVVNYSTRLLGREGVMKAVLVSDPQSLEKDMPGFRHMLTGFEFVSGRRYAEFRDGDKTAAYGLAALVAGGAAAAAAKTGAGKAIWKFIVGGLVLFGGALLALFRRLTGKRESQS